VSARLHQFNADLHSHSTASDGALAPGDLVLRAQQQGVELLALTDHDTVDGLAEARCAAVGAGLPFVAGVELSVTFAGKTVHVVGLGIDPAAPALCAGLATVRSGRLQRAQAMADGLAAAGIDGALSGALRHAANPHIVSRTHFARYLVEIGAAADLREVFGRYLAEGRPGYVAHCWAALVPAVGWIRAAGGVAVLAHPARYGRDAAWQWALCCAFRDAGGAALEIVTSSHSPDDARRFAALAREFSFEGSRGSDFHAPGESHAELGRLAPLPHDLVPVWHRFT
jgi:predicted metal-dependent phosphoesterase TrpH